VKEVRDGRCEVFTGKAWPGECLFIDFVNASARKLWSSMYSYDNYKHSAGLSVWNDLNE
jgi:alpha-glucosidase (family GH31 glycosyl hydrolase)